MDKRMIKLLPLVLIFFSLFIQCKDDPQSITNNNGTSQAAEVRFELTKTAPTTGRPTAGATVFTARVEHHCIDQTNPGCFSHMFVRAPEDNGDWLSFPISEQSCTDFIAVLTSSNLEYTFIGNVQRLLHQGTDPFASGSYEVTNQGATVEVGTFVFFEQLLTATKTDVCQ